LKDALIMMKGIDTVVDPTKWNRGWWGEGVTGPVNGAETACYDSANATESGGYLHLWLEAVPSTCQTYAMDNTGAHINSNGKFEFAYGAVEFRAYVPAAGSQVANWPALWHNGHDWPVTGENDVFEGLDGAACYHFHSSTTEDGGCAAGTWTGWHTFGSEWSPGEVRYYYDGELVGTLSEGITGDPHYLILQNTAGEWGGDTVTPADFRVDYVRVWQRP
jgi:beta-glucanase (GH16 family)